MKLTLYQVDAFTDKIFSGNPAAVVPLKENWLEKDLMQKIALENNLSETAFYIFKDNIYHIRWFTPEIEVDLCGHATLATGHVLFNHENFTGNEIEFKSRSGLLKIERNNDLLILDFPADEIMDVELTEDIKSGFDIKPIRAIKGISDYMLIFEKEEQIKNLKYEISEIIKIDSRGIIVTAPGNDVDFVSRYFGPQSGIDEDPVTGSAHTTLTPYWASVLNKTELTARQLSKRGGYLECKLEDNRIKISGEAVTYLIGEIVV